MSRLPDVSVDASGANVATGFFCSTANLHAFIAPPSFADWATSTPRAKATINLFRFRSVSADARAPNPSSLTKRAPG